MTDALLAANKSTPNQVRPYTLINDPEITNIIAHLNEEHFDELLGFLGVFTSLSLNELNNIDVQLTAIYSEGIEVQVQPKNQEQQPTDSQNKTLYDQTFFIGFATPITEPDELQTQYILLKQRADKKLGKKSIKLTKQTFIVQDSYRVSKNMLRLTLDVPALSLPALSENDPSNTNPTSIPMNEAGYAYLFDLEHNVIASNHINSGIKDSSHPARPHCYYTLRKAWQNSDGLQAWVDVFVHGNTPGGNWATALQAGDTVITKREFPEKVEHLRDGQALLIVDETSMPTAARLLELWDNPKPPLIVCVTQDAADQSYFDDIKINHDVKGSIDGNFTVLPIVIGSINSEQSLATLIDSKLSDYLTEHPLQIDKVWGALEASTVKALRPMLRERFELSRAEVVVKVYWRQD
ncbi:MULTISPECIES: siderophore-interacting protein [Psychrobacter]|uniref:siderophore-interacting protein n=1 Tax=Psychrobacter TaxID=497 RepID=UPI00041B7A98|nr:MULTISPECIES: siderophore-interacting protein [Psychrobacter]PKG34242.1 siderophore-interacting protein [Psychrobacter sp. Sarcosine-3u-12]